jgi:competence ComEA-like helix-hairpin-helix protein
MDPSPPPAPSPGTGQEFLTAWPRSAQLAAAFLLGVFLTLVAVRGYQASRFAGRPTELERGAAAGYRGSDPRDGARTAYYNGGRSEPAHVDDSGDFQGARRPSPNGGSEATSGGRIDVNRASPAELERLPGIGPKMAARIADERSKRPFRSPDDLRRVPGIGPKTLEKLRPLVTTGDQIQ